MNGGNPVILAVAAVAVLVFAAFLLFLFTYLRLWIQALLTNTPAGIGDIIRMRLRGCPPQLLVHAMIALGQRGVKVSAGEMESYYFALSGRGGPPLTATELAAGVEAARRGESAQT
jgi:uncharacterized protein YqfA (UPF0365 family)